MSAPDGWPAWRDRLGTKLAGTLDDEVRGKAALVLVDDLAAMVAGHEHAEVRAFAAPLLSEGGEASLLRRGASSTRERAAAANAVAAAWDELDEGYRPATAHGGLYTVPAVVAEAEATGATLDDVLSAIVVGYEVATGVARLFPAPKPLVLHPHATVSPIGAAAALAWLRTRDAGVVLSAVDVAATLSMTGPFRHATTGAQVRNLWAGAGAALGFLAAGAAVSGLGSDPDSLVDVFGATYGHPIAESELREGPDPARWAILDGYHKLYAACQYTHSALEAAADVAGQLGGAVGRGEVEEVLVQTHPLALPLSDPQPRTALGGKFSVPHVVASVLASGRTDAVVFGADGLAEPATAALRPLVRLAPFEPLPEAPHDRPARVEVRLRDGSRRTAVCLSAVGGPDRPLGVEDVLGKIADLTGSTAPGFATAARGIVLGAVFGGTPWAQVLGTLLADGDR
jgi:2-methylcitrate dehydratase PrpD